MCVTYLHVCNHLSDMEHQFLHAQRKVNCTTSRAASKDFSADVGVDYRAQRPKRFLHARISLST